MAPTDWADDEYEQVRWNRHADNEWNSSTASNNYGAGAKIVTIEDPDLRKNHDKLIKRYEALKKETKELRKFKKKASVLERVLKEIENNAPKLKIARLVRRIGVVR